MEDDSAAVKDSVAADSGAAKLDTASEEEF
jgi:hypothetical protein